ncbi:hypothetical protein [Geoalkalibacter sp.]|uniref:hypothetical protein n=1 Tax=Geoalkalibacter sp. TaxID=3041440 RepID=UPI00272E7FAE|nr:hypothetical protein [Geoalkalibacter sp.]
MKRDRQGKVEFIGGHIPEFLGYRAIDHGQTDRLLRHYLAGRLAGVRDRLADFIAGLGEEGVRRVELAEALRRLARQRERLLLDSEEKAAAPAVRLDEDEALLDFDLNLLDKVAALDSALDNEGALDGHLLLQLLDEYEGLLEKRAAIFRQAD